MGAKEENLFRELNSIGVFNSNDIIGLLKCGTQQYNVSIVLKDRANNTSPSITKQITTNACPPPPAIEESSFSQNSSSFGANSIVQILLQATIENVNKAKICIAIAKNSIEQKILDKQLLYENWSQGQIQSLIVDLCKIDQSYFALGPYPLNEDSNITYSRKIIQQKMSLATYALKDLNDIVYQKASQQQRDNAAASATSIISGAATILSAFAAGTICESIALATTAGSASPACVALGGFILGTVATIATEGPGNINLYNLGLDAALTFIPLGKLGNVIAVMKTASGKYLIREGGGRIETKILTPELEKVLQQVQSNSGNILDGFDVAYTYTRNGDSTVKYLTGRSINHIIERHGTGAVYDPSNPNEKFLSNDIAGLIQQGIKYGRFKPNPLKPGGVQYDYEFNFQIGWKTTQVNGQPWIIPTNIVRVLTDADGRVITAFPADFIAN